MEDHAGGGFVKLTRAQILELERGDVYPEELNETLAIDTRAEVQVAVWLIYRVK